MAEKKYWLFQLLLDTLENIPAITWKGVEGFTHWQFMNAENQSVDIKFKPRLIVDDITMMRNAALDGLGLVLIPYIYVENVIALGRIIHIESELIPRKSIIRAVHLGQKGMRSAVRHLLDWLKELTVNLR
ncbi:LysR substrate-binding domain-containing protein [Acinetobacter sp. YH12023]|uniref:LysR substrate-binding domain-containing protein n=1 Tax=Acinetobacter sp. YH12023 TaxID=2601041 RepID=UPI00211DD914|nr:LysR substrate-binding domain-containing protein [Acinetobacter sp. YH12023]